MALLIRKEKIEKNTDMILNMERYRETTKIETKFETKELKEILNFIWKWIRPASFANQNGNIPFIVSSNKIKYCSEADYHEEAICIWDWGSANVHYVNWDFSVSDHVYLLENKDVENINLKYVYYILSKNLEVIEWWFQWQWLKNVSKKYLESIAIPLPSREIQDKIVIELDNYQKIIDWANVIVENYKPTIQINPEWKMMKFWDLYLEPSKNWLTKPTSIRWSGYKMVNMGELFANDKIWDIDMELVPLTDSEKDKNWLQENDLLFARQSLTIQWAWKCSIITEIKEYTTFESHIIRVRLNEELVNPYFYFYYLNSLNSPVKSIVTYNWQAWIRWSELSELFVIYPPLEIQNQIVAEIEKEEVMVENAKQLIEVFEKKIKDKIDEIWGK